MRLGPLGLLAALALATAGAGCGKTETVRHSAGQTAETIPAVSEQGAVGLQTSNTTRLGGADTVSDAAAVARTVYPALTSATRPQAVVLVGSHDWAAALTASALAGAPLGAPLLYTEDGTLPEATSAALQALHPLGAKALGGAQVIQIGTSAALPEGLRSRTVPVAGEQPAAVAAALEHVLEVVRGGAPHQVIVLPAGAPQALQMPAAGLSAESGAPILFVTTAGVPGPTATTLAHLGRPSIYVIDPSALDAATLAALSRFGRVTPIPAGSTPAEQNSPVENAIAVARFTDGTFGWGVKEPGHGLVFANAGRPFDAPAGALLSASGDYGPLLLLEGPHGVPAALSRYLADIQPAYGSTPQYAPVHGAYNHGWLIGDETAISPTTQAELDSMLEISPRHVSSSEEESPSPE
ncbi:MAG: cell wall-binding repeat-containing protein [Solirubrobacteraceae bacterium]